MASAEANKSGNNVILPVSPVDHNVRLSHALWQTGEIQLTEENITRVETISQAGTTAATLIATLLSRGCISHGDIRFLWSDLSDNVGKSLEKFSDPQLRRFADISNSINFTLPNEYIEKPVTTSLSRLNRLIPADAQIAIFPPNSIRMFDFDVQPDGSIKFYINGETRYEMDHGLLDEVSRWTERVLQVTGADEPIGDIQIDPKAFTQGILKDCIATQRHLVEYFEYVSKNRYIFSGGKNEMKDCTQSTDSVEMFEITHRKTVNEAAGRIIAEMHGGKRIDLSKLHEHVQLLKKFVSLQDQQAIAEFIGSFINAEYTKQELEYWAEHEDKEPRYNKLLKMKNVFSHDPYPMPHMMYIKAGINEGEVITRIVLDMIPTALNEYYQVHFNRAPTVAETLEFARTKGLRFIKYVAAGNKRPVFNIFHETADDKGNRQLTKKLDRPLITIAENPKSQEPDIAFDTNFFTTEQIVLLSYMHSPTLNGSDRTMCPALKPGVVENLYLDSLEARSHNHVLGY